jgi:hypothetical protein
MRSPCLADKPLSSGPREVSEDLSLSPGPAASSEDECDEKAVGSTHIRANPKRNFQMAEAKWPVCQEEPPGQGRWTLAW